MTERADGGRDRTLVLAKPDAVRRRLVGVILARIEAKGYCLVAAELRRPSREQFEQHYANLAGEPFLPTVLDFMTSGPIVAAVFEGTSVVESVRRLAGATNPVDAAPGTIRGDLARAWPTPAMENLVHCSDSAVAADTEIALWFPQLA